MKAAGQCMSGGPLNGGSKPTRTPQPTKAAPVKGKPSGRRQGDTSKETSA